MWQYLNGQSPEYSFCLQRIATSATSSFATLTRRRMLALYSIGFAK